MLRACAYRGLRGINCRDDTILERLCRAGGVLLVDPRWVLGPLRRWALERIAGLGTSAPRLAWDYLLGRARIDNFSVVSHHFMSAFELLSEKGQERVAACVFRVPVDGKMVSMCRVNAGGVRDAAYVSISDSTRQTQTGRQPGLNGNGI